MDRFDGCGEAGTICYNFGGGYYLLKSRKKVLFWLRKCTGTFAFYQ